MVSFTSTSSQTRIVVSACEAIAPLSDRYIAVKSGISGEWHVLSTREWVVLKQAPCCAGSSELASQSTAALQTLLGVRPLLEPCDGMPGWMIGCVLSLNPRTRRHRDELWPVSDAEAGGLLERFLSCQLLASAPAQSSGLHSDPVTAVAVMACDRPRRLRRILQHLVASAEADSTPITIQVHDVSRCATKARENQQLCAVTSAGRVAVRYFGRPAREAMFARLVRSGIEPWVAQSALWGIAGFRSGANRNSALLQSAGQRIIVLDQDVTGRVWVPFNIAQGIRLTHEKCPMSFAFSHTAEALREGMIPQREPIWFTHGSVLGMPVQTAIEAHGISQPTIGGIVACPSWGELLVASGGRVRASLDGTIVTLGAQALERVLATAAATGATIVGDPVTPITSLMPRQLRTSTDRIQLSPQGSGPTASVGLDGCGLLPPFAGYDSYDDSLFFDLLSVIDRRGVVAFLPQTVESWSTRNTIRMFGHASTSPADIVRTVLATRCVFGRAGLPAEKLDSLGRALRETAAAETMELLDFVRVVRARQLTTWLDRANVALCDPQAELLGWAKHLRDAQQKLLSEDACSNRAVLHASPNQNKSMAWLRTVIADLGELYRAWPHIWATAIERP